MAEFIFIIAGYFFGSIPWGYLLCKIFAGKDVRNYGSGNIGATNVYRTAGGVIAACVLFLDIFKGFLPVFIAKQYFDFTPLHLIAVGIAAVLGHTFSIFLKGKGGKGVATSFGVIIGLFPAAALFTLITWIILTALTRYVSIGSVLASFALPLFIHAAEKNVFYTSTGIILFLLIAYSHRANIKRIFEGTENRLKFPWEKQ